MKKLILASLLVVFMLVYGCTSSIINFDQGIKKINEFDKEYNSTIRSPPSDSAKIGPLKSDLEGYKSKNRLSEPLIGLIDFKIAFLDAEKLNAKGWQWGRASTTQYGFGCKGYDNIKESARLRNASAEQGYLAVDKLEQFVKKFPEESKKTDLTQKDALVLNAMYFQIQQQAKKDAGTIEFFCGKKGNETKEAAS